jgi:hypothetical protein
LQSALSKTDELFGDLYGRAIDVLSEQPLRRGSLVIAGHCIRDIANGLPDALGDVEMVPAYSNPTEPARELAEVWVQNETILGPVGADSDVTRAPESPEARLTVPTALLYAAQKVVRTSLNGTSNARIRYSALVLGRAESREDPAVKLFKGCAASSFP